MKSPCRAGARLQSPPGSKSFTKYQWTVQVIELRRCYASRIVRSSRWRGKNRNRVGLFCNWRAAAEAQPFFLSRPVEQLAVVDAVQPSKSVVDFRIYRGLNSFEKFPGGCFWSTLVWTMICRAVNFGSTWPSCISECVAARGSKW